MPKKKTEVFIKNFDLSAFTASHIAQENFSLKWLSTSIPPSRDI